MSKSKKTYTDLQRDIARLIEQADALKGQKLDVITTAFEKEFKKKAFQEKVVSADDAVLKKAVKDIVSNFDSILLKAKTELDAETQKSQNATTPIVPTSALQ